MEKDVALGTVGKISFTFLDGKARVEMSAAFPQAGASAGAFIEDDATMLVDALFAAIEKSASPGTVAIEEGVKAIVKAAVASIK